MTQSAALQAATSSAATQPRRMSLASVHVPREIEGWSGLVYSVEGLGKTTFGASTPAPIFIAPETGFPRGVRPPLFPPPRKWNDLYEAIRELREGRHAYRTLVFDTLDWLMPLLFAYVMAKNGVASMELVGGGFNRGYDHALTEILRLLGRLEDLRQNRNMNILFLVHAEISTFRTPQGLDYDHWEPKLHKKISAKVREWCHWVLFGNFEMAVSGSKGKAFNGATGLRMVYTTLTQLYKAKNRHGMPDSLPFDWEVVAKYLDADEEEMADRCASLRRQILSVLEQLLIDDVKKKQALEWASDVQVPSRLQIGLNRMMAQLEEQQERFEQAAAAEEMSQRQLPEDMGDTPPSVDPPSSEPPRPNDGKPDAEGEPAGVHQPTRNRGRAAPRTGGAAGHSR